MIQIELNGKEYLIKSKLSELTLGEFEFISNKLENFEHNVSKWIDIIHFLTDIPMDEVEGIPSTKFQLLVDRLFEQDLTLDKITKLEIDNLKYNVSDLTARDMTLLEKIFFQKHPNRISVTIAARFRQEGLSNKENYDTVFERAELFRMQSIVGLIPYLTDGVIGFLEYLKTISPININENETESVA